jgi:hypothetical protein
MKLNVILEKFKPLFNTILYLVSVLFLLPETREFDRLRVDIFIGNPTLGKFSMVLVCVMGICIVASDIKSFSKGKKSTKIMRLALIILKSFLVCMLIAHTYIMVVCFGDFLLGNNYGLIDDLQVY